LNYQSLVGDFIARARKAQVAAESWGQREVDEVVSAVGWSVYREDNSRFLADLAYRETGLGDLQDLHELHRKRVLGTLCDLAGVRTVGCIDENPDAGTQRYAKPIGVIAAATPATAPCTGIATNVLQMLKARNAVVVSPNPRARESAARTVDFMRQALDMVGAPQDLVQCLPPVDREGVEYFMSHADLVVATGGQGTVNRAYRSGRPAISAGVGNPVILVDETADLALAAPTVLRGAGYNNGTSCSSESNVVVSAEVAEEFLAEVAAAGGHVCTPEQAERLKATLWHDGRLNRDAVGRSVAELAALAGFGAELTEGAVALVVEADPTALGDPLLTEKLSPVLALLVCRDFTESLDVAEGILERCGAGHSCGIYTGRDDRVEALALRMNSCRVMVNQSTGAGNTGSFQNGLPFTSIVSSGSWGGCSQSENITWRHFVNLTTVSRPIERPVPTEAEVFASHWAAYGR
jgi:sulfoacetaldehyde dehydrogenase